MIILILGIVVVILAVLGVTFLVKGYLKVPDPGEIVPLADLNKVKDDLALKTEEEGRLKLQIDSIVIELEETKMKLEEVERTGGGSEVSKVKEEEYKTRIQALENDLTQIRTKANSLAQESIDVINTLDVKNKELQEKVKAAEQYQEKLQALDQLMEEKQVLVSQLEENAVKINDLESNQERIQNRSEEKVREANALAEGLVVKNKKLNEGLKNITAKIDEVETEFVKVKDGKEKELKEANLMVSQLLDEINSLQTRIDGNDTKIKKLEDNLVATKSDVTLAAGGKDAGVMPREADVAKIKEMNAFLVEKEKRLQLKLSQSRAQAMGLQKICEEYRSQLEQGQ